jgi:hypothetical protein
VADFIVIHGTTQVPEGWSRLAAALADILDQLATAS